MKKKKKINPLGARITDWNAFMIWLAGVRKEAMDAGYAQGVENTEARLVRSSRGRKP